MPSLDPLASALLNDNHTARIYAAADGRIAFWNAGAEALFGHAAADAIGQRLDLVVPEQHRAMHWIGFDRTIGSMWRGSPSWGPVAGLHKTGREVPLEVLLLPVHGADARVTGVLASFRPPAV